MLEITKNFISNLKMSRYSRIEGYLSDLKENVKIKSKEDKEFLNQMEEIVSKKISQIKSAYFFLGIFYFGIYFSFVSIFFSDVFFLTELRSFISKIVGFFGTTIFFIGVFIVNKFLELYYQDLNLFTSHMIAIYDKNLKNKTEVFEEKSHYGVFIDFFKKRGF